MKRLLSLVEIDEVTNTVKVYRLGEEKLYCKSGNLEAHLRRGHVCQKSAGLLSMLGHRRLGC